MLFRSTWFALAFIFLVIVLMSFHEDARMALVVGPILLAIYFVLYFILGIDKKQVYQLGEQK